MCVHWYLSNHKVLTVKGKFHFLEKKKEPKLATSPKVFSWHSSVKC